MFRAPPPLPPRVIYCYTHLNKRMVLAFVGWLVTVRKVCSGTISQYLSGLRIVHLKNGVLPSNLRPDIIKAILRGRQQIESGTKIPKLAMTIPVMRLLRKLIKMSNSTESKKRLTWAICCIAFNGSFRQVKTLLLGVNCLK